MKKSLLTVLLIQLFLAVTAFAQKNAPTLYSPSNGVKNQQPIVTCRWYADTSATSFTLEISTDSSFSSANTNIHTNIKPTSLRLTGLKASTTYFWRVKAYFSSGDSSSFSDTFSFATGDAPSAKISMSSATVCIYNTVNLSFTATGLAPIKYSWTFSGGSIDSSVSANPSIYFTTPGTYAVTLTLTNVFGSTSITEYIDVLSNLNDAKIVRAPGATKCIGNEITLTAYPAGMIYTWSNGAKTQSIKIKDTGYYSVNVTNGACSTNAYIRVDHDFIPLKITPSTKYLCYEDSIKLDAGSGFISYKWYTGQTTQIIYAKHPGSYYVWAVSKDSCIFFGSTWMQYRYDSAFRISANGLTYNKTCSGNVTLSVPKIAGLSKYKWSTGDTTATTTIDSAGYYSVSAEDANGCKTFTGGFIDYKKVQCMSGIYTIGGKNPDFKTIQEAAAALRNNLVGGDVTFNIRDGVYSSSETIDLSFIGIVGGKYKIIFQSESGDANKVKIFSTTGSYYGTFLQINTPDISIRNLTIYTGGTSNFIWVGDNGDHVSFEGNIILDSSYSSPFTLLGIQADNAFIASNTFGGGSYSIAMSGVNNAIIEKNKFGGHYTNMINIATGKNIKISNNTTYFYGYSARYSQNTTGINLYNVHDFVIAGNNLVERNSSNNLNDLVLGIRLENCSNSDTTTPHIYNNILEGRSYGLQLISSSNINIYHNNIYSNYRGIKLTDAYNLRLVNNNIYNGIIADNNKYSISEIKTNNYYPDAYSSYFIKEAKNLEGNSISVDPFYPNFIELYAKNKELDKAGTVINEVDKDIHGKKRDMQNADIGAEELIETNDLTIDSIYLPTEKCGYSAYETLQFRISNLSNLVTQTIPTGAGNISFGYQIDNQVPVTLNSNLSKPETVIGSYVMTYINKLNLATPGKYKLKVWVSMLNDTNRSNDTLSVVVNSKAAPKPVFYYTGTCAGDTIVFTNYSTFTGSEPQYTWIFHNGSTKTTKNATMVYSKPGSYNVKLVAVSPSGCKDSVTKVLTIYSKPVAQIKRQGNLLYVTTKGLFYQWLLNGDSIPLATADNWYADQDGKYSVIITNEVGCFNTTDEYNFIYTGLEEKNLSSKIEIYPNPAHGKTLITGLESKSKLNTINIYDVIGKCVYTESIKNSSQNNNIELDLSSLKPGVYWLELGGDNTKINRKLIVY